MSNRLNGLNGKINSSLKKYMNDSINESMRKKMEYFTRAKFTSLLKNITYKNDQQMTSSNQDILTESTNVEQNNNKNTTIIDSNYSNYSNYLNSFFYHFYSKIKTNFFVFLLLIYNGDHNK